MDRRFWVEDETAVEKATVSGTKYPSFVEELKARTEASEMKLKERLEQIDLENSAFRQRLNKDLDRQVKGKTLTFGVSGLLWDRSLVMYDVETESHWSHIRGEAMQGEFLSAKLVMLSSQMTTWDDWLAKHPETTVLSFNTGHSRDYSRDPYESYYRDRRGMFSSFFKAGPGEEEKELVAGVVIGEAARAYPVDAIRSAGTIKD